MAQRGFGRIAALVLAGALGAAGVDAQETQPAPAAAQPAPETTAPAKGGIEEIIVTSRQREESIQEVPIAVTQFGQDAIESIAPNTLRDFDGLTPNLFIGMNTAGPGASAIYIRGLGYADIEKTQTPNVGVVIDGVFIPSSTGQLIDTFDIESLEINRGPQAILWGRNTSGGTIVVRRGRPQLDDWSAKLYASYGDFIGGEGEGGAFKVQGVANVPLIDESMALRIGYTYKDEDGYVRNELNGESRGAVDYNAFNAKLLWEPVEDLSLLFNWDWIEDRSDIPAQDPLFDGDDPFINRADRVPSELAPYNVSVVSLEANYELPFDARLTSISAYWDSHDLVYQDFDGGFSNPANPLQNDPNEVFARLHTRREQEFDVFSQELRLQGTLLDESLVYIAGFYYARDDHDHDQRTEQMLQLNFGLPIGVNCAAVPPIAAAGFIVDGAQFNGFQYCATPTSFSWQVTHLTNKSWALFGSLEYEIPFVEGLRVNGGVRWINEEKKFDTRFDNIANGTIVGAIQGANVLTLAPLTDDWDDVVFEAGVNYQVLENMLAYYRFAQGFRSGGFSLRGSDPANWPITFEPENTDAHEVGLKTSWIDGRLVANLAGFYNKVEGAQASSIISGVTVVGTNTLILNGGKAEIYGVELQSNVEVLEGLDVSFTLGWQKGESITSTQNTHNLPAPAGNTVCFQALGGTSLATCPSITFRDQDLGRVPELTWSVGGSYRYPIGAGEAVLGVRYKKQDAFWIIPPTKPSQQDQITFGLPPVVNTAVRQGEYKLLDANASYEFKVQERSVRIGVVGKNLTGEEYLEQNLPLGPGGFQGWGPPRYVGGEVTFEL